MLVLPQPPRCLDYSPTTLPLLPFPGGGFTNVDPESRRIVPEANGRTQLKVVYVVLEAQYQASLGAAVNKINAHRKEVCVELSGYLLEELRDAKNFEKFKADVADGELRGLCGCGCGGEPEKSHA